MAAAVKPLDWERYVCEACGPLRLLRPEGPGAPRLEVCPSCKAPGLTFIASIAGVVRPAQRPELVAALGDLDRALRLACAALSAAPAVRAELERGQAQLSVLYGHLVEAGWVS